MSFLTEGDVTVLGRVHLEYTPSSSLSHTISVGFSVAKKYVKKRSAATEEAAKPPGCQVETVTLTCLRGSGNLGSVVPATSQEPYQHAWTFNSATYLVFDHYRYGDNAITGLQFELRIKSSGTQHMARFFVRDLGSPKALLGNANKTGDLNLICKDSSKVPAHSAVLDSIPYFEAKIKDAWSGTEWNKNKKLDLELPHPVDRQVLGAFLEYAYGNVGVLDQIDSDASMMQDLLFLADACGFSVLCSAIEEIITVDATSAPSWLELLSKVHAEGVYKIHEKVKEVVREDYLRTELWDDLTVEQLRTLEDMSRKHKVRKLER